MFLVCMPVSVCLSVCQILVKLADRYGSLLELMNNVQPMPLGIRAQRQSARISKTTNDGLTQSDTGCFVAVAI